MISFKISKRVFILLIILIAIILCFWFYKNNVAIEIILSVALILIIWLTKKEHRLEDYAPYVMIIIIAFFTIYNLKSYPQPQISVEIVQQIFEPPRPIGWVHNIVKINKLEVVTFVPSGPDFDILQISHTLDYLDENPTPNNQYHIIIQNNGTIPIKSLNIYAQTPFDIKKEDIIISDGITDYNIDASGKLYLIIDFLDVGEIATINFKNKNIGNIKLNRCLINNEPISCNAKTYNISLIRVPKNRIFELKSQSGTPINWTIPILSKNGLYDIMNNGTLKYRPYRVIPEGMAPSLSTYACK